MGLPEFLKNHNGATACKPIFMGLTVVFAILSTFGLLLWFHPELFPADWDVVPTEEVAPTEGVTNPANGAVTDPDGAVTDPDGAVTDPDGAVTDPDGAVTDPDGAVTDPDGAVAEPNGAADTADEAGAPGDTPAEGENTPDAEKRDDSEKEMTWQILTATGTVGFMGMGIYAQRKKMWVTFGLILMGLVFVSVAMMLKCGVDFTPTGEGLTNSATLSTMTLIGIIFMSCGGLLAGFSKEPDEEDSGNTDSIAVASQPPQSSASLDQSDARRLIQEKLRFSDHSLLYAAAFLVLVLAVYLFIRVSSLDENRGSARYVVKKSAIFHRF